MIFLNTKSKMNNYINVFYKKIYCNMLAPRPPGVRRTAKQYAFCTSPNTQLLLGLYSYGPSGLATRFSRSASAKLGLANARPNFRSWRPLGDILFWAVKQQHAVLACCMKQMGYIGEIYGNY
jgi:hypothetical protein